MYVKLDEIRIDNLPQDIEDFKKAAVNMMMDPVKTAALFIFALNIYSNNKEIGYLLLNYLVADDINASRFDSIEQNPHIAKSYLKGAIPENNYTPLTPYTVLVKTDRDKGIKRNLKTVYIGCGGTDSYRPLTLVKIKRRKLAIKSKFDLWYVKEYPSIILDVKEAY